MPKQTFIQSIHAMKKNKISFFSNEDGRIIERTCAPMDFGPSKRFKDGIDRFHVWDYFPDGGKAPHPIPIKQNDLKTVTALAATFNPSDFIKWKFVPNSWHVARNWGQFS
jgi:hypothetical protein